MLNAGFFPPFCEVFKAMGMFLNFLKIKTLADFFCKLWDVSEMYFFVVILSSENYVHSPWFSVECFESPWIPSICGIFRKFKFGWEFFVELYSVIFLNFKNFHCMFSTFSDSKNRLSCQIFRMLGVQGSHWLDVSWHSQDFRDSYLNMSEASIIIISIRITFFECLVFGISDIFGCWEIARIFILVI